MHWDQRPRDSVAIRKIRKISRDGRRTALLPPALALLRLAAVLIAKLFPNFLHAELSERVWVPHFLVVLRADKW